MRERFSRSQSSPRVGWEQTEGKERYGTHGAAMAGCVTSEARSRGSCGRAKMRGHRRCHSEGQKRMSRNSNAAREIVVAAGATAGRSSSVRHSHDVDASSSATAWPGRNSATRARYRARRGRATCGTSGAAAAHGSAASRSTKREISSLRLGLRGRQQVRPSQRLAER